MFLVFHGFSERFGMDGILARVDPGPLANGIVSVKQEKFFTLTNL